MSIPAFPDWLKRVLLVVSAAAGTVSLVWPGTTYAAIAAVVVSLIAGLGVTSGGVSGQRSDQARAVHAELQDRKVIAP
jgi:hypothetical protein